VTVLGKKRGGGRKKTGEKDRVKRGIVNERTRVKGAEKNDDSLKIAQKKKRGGKERERKG